MRADRRAADEMRPISFETRVSAHAEGSCLVKFGRTHVLCMASVEEKLPPWMRGKGRGWVTAEYAMLPRATHDRSARESVKGKQGGRTLEISRLIGRALRAVVSMEALGERQITLDCDVLQADGGTRTAAISGAWVALRLAIDGLRLAGTDPMPGRVAAVSCGVVGGVPVLDLDYPEDSTAGTDGNFVLAEGGRLVEVQASAEGAPFDEEQLLRMLRLARIGGEAIMAAQAAAVGR